MNAWVKLIPKIGLASKMEAAGPRKVALMLTFEFRASAGGFEHAEQKSTDSIRP